MHGAYRNEINESLDFWTRTHHNPRMDTRPVVVITGATNGLGKVAAFDLARWGAHLGIVARSPEKVAALRREIDEAAPGTPVDSFIADLTSLRDVRRAGQEIDAHY